MSSGRTRSPDGSAFLFAVCSWAVRGDVQHTVPWCASPASARSKFPDRARLRSRERADAVSAGEAEPLLRVLSPRTPSGWARLACAVARPRLVQPSSGAAAHRCRWRVGRHGPVREPACSPSAR